MDNTVVDHHLKPIDGLPEVMWGVPTYRPLDSGVITGPFLWFGERERMRGIGVVCSVGIIVMERH